MLLLSIADTKVMGSYFRKEYVSAGIEKGRCPDLVGGGLIRSHGGWVEAKNLVRVRVDLKEMSGYLEIVNLF